MYIKFAWPLFLFTVKGNIAVKQEVKFSKNKSR